jgi:hypothetical protein
MSWSELIAKPDIQMVHPLAACISALFNVVAYLAAPCDGDNKQITLLTSTRHDERCMSWANEAGIVP